MDLFTKRNLILEIAILFLIVAFLGCVFIFNLWGDYRLTEYSIGQKKMIAEKDEIIRSLLAEGRYKCCLKEPCSYCFFDSDHMNEELICDCLEDVMNGGHPCGECIGEILEGNGNPLISEYFAIAIADEIGPNYLLMLRQIISEKYGVPVDQQL